MNEDKAARYHRLRRRSAILGVLWSGSFLAGLTLAGGAQRLGALAADLASLSGSSPAWLPTVQVAAFVIFASLLHDLVGLPLAFYGGLVLDRRHGLSSETTPAWLWNHVKFTGLALAFAVVAGCGTYAALAAWPQWWWLAAWAGFVSASVALVYVAPVVILPLFFTVRPLRREQLRSRLTALASRVGTPVLGVYEWTVSHRSRKANAALGDYSDDEIEVMLAHELGHHVHRDILHALLAEALLSLAGFYATHRVLVAIAGLRWLGLSGPADVNGMPALLLCGGLWSLLLVPVANAISRHDERRADQFAIEATGHAAAFISAMRRMAAQNLAEQSPSRLVRSLFYTHPPVAERIRFAEAWAAGCTARPAGATDSTRGAG
jgi:STE24 endopeptidase